MFEQLACYREDVKLERQNAPVMKIHTAKKDFEVVEMDPHHIPNSALQKELNTSIEENIQHILLSINQTRDRITQSENQIKQLQQTKSYKKIYDIELEQMISDVKNTFKSILENIKVVQNTLRQLKIQRTTDSLQCRKQIYENASKAQKIAKEIINQILVLNREAIYLNSDIKFIRQNKKPYNVPQRDHLLVELKTKIQDIKHKMLDLNKLLIQCAQ